MRNSKGIPSLLLGLIERLLSQGDQKIPRVMDLPYKRAIINTIVNIVALIQLQALIVKEHGRTRHFVQRQSLVNTDSPFSHEITFKKNKDLLSPVTDKVEL